jgi:HNH endonuclease
MGSLGWRKGTLEQRLLSKVNARNYHWLWTGAKNNRGYGTIGISENGVARHEYAHRVSYTLFVGPIPEGKELDHLPFCRIPACICPWHLEPVTHQVNCLRGFSPPAMHARKMHCVNGHELSGDNLWIDSRNSRVCLTCKRSREKSAYHNNIEERRRKHNAVCAKFRQRHPGYWKKYYQTV